MLKSSSQLWFSLTLSLLLACYGLAHPANAQTRLETLAGNGSVLLHSPDSTVRLSLNEGLALPPASLVKIPLAQVALHSLGEDYRFETLFYRNNEGDLLIRGQGDPFLVSEEIALIAENLVRSGLTKVRRLVVDDSAFAPDLDLPLEAGTDQPYDARNSALAVNFNTVNLAWSNAGALISGEPQTPLTDLARELGARLRVGEPQRINLGADPLASRRQAQQLFRIFFEASGITVSDAGYYEETVNGDWTLFYRHESSISLREILEGMLRYSNNFIANQLFLTLGAQHGGYPVTTEAARTALHEHLTTLYGESFGRDPVTLLMREGSGLSRDQRSTAAGMMRILEVFKPHAELLPETNGALRKSGTLTGVYNFAGYIRGPDGLYPFVIMTNQAVNNRNEILRLLQAEVSSR